MTLTTLEILKRGRERVALAWCQGRSYDEATGAYCAVAAFETGLTKKDEYQRGRNALYAACPEASRGLVYWNDRPERTQAEVVALFDRAIARLEAEGQEAGR